MPVSVELGWRESGRDNAFVLERQGQHAVVVLVVAERPPPVVVAQPIGDVAAIRSPTRSLEHVGVGADDGGDPRCGQGIGQRLLVGVRAGLVLGSPMQVGDHHVRAGLGRFDAGQQLAGIGVGNTGTGRAGREMCQRLVLDLAGRDHGHPHAIDGRVVRSKRLGRVGAKAHHRKAAATDRGQRLGQPGRAVVGAVIVGHGGDVDAGVLERGQRGRGRLERERLVLRLATDRDRGFQVDHGQVGLGQHRLGHPERGGRIALQQRGGALGEMHVAGEGHGELAGRLGRDAGSRSAGRRGGGPARGRRGNSGRGRTAGRVRGRTRVAAGDQGQRAAEHQQGHIGSGQSGHRTSMQCVLRK